MTIFFPLYLIAFLIGMILGHLFPSLSAWYVGLGATALAVLLVEAYGAWGFGSHWRGYSSTLHMMRSVPVLMLYFGTLLGSGKFGQFLIHTGTLLT